jgi:hypothetical protein
MLNCTIALIALLTVSSVMGQRAKLQSPLTTTDNVKTLTVCYDITGLGNVTQVTMTLLYNAVVNSECFNPGNKEGSVPGQNQVFSGVGDEFTVPVHNGRATGCFTTNENEFPAGGCPSSSWTGVVTNVTFSNITLQVLGRTFSAPNPVPNP